MKSNKKHNYMSRELKFRLWDGTKMETKVMFGSLGAFYVPGMDYKDSATMCSFNTKYPHDSPVMQFTGELIDGKEVYMADVVALYENGKEYFRGKVTDHGVHGITIDSHSDYMEFGLTKRFSYKLLGNIHEHPELLK